MARYVAGLERYRAGSLSCVAAADLLGISERHFRRLRDRYEAEGAEGLIDRRRGKASGRRVAVDRIEWVLDQFATRYFDFTAKHFHEELVKRGFDLSYTWTKTLLQQRGLIGVAPRRSAHRKKRVRRPLPGMMLFQDGSTHEWLAGRPPLDLIVTLDDATSEVYSMFLVEQEGTASSFRGLAETIARKGLFSSFYTDRGSHYFFTPKAGEKVSKETLTQVGRGVAELGIEHIASYSPEGRGRMERVFGTLQNRLPQVLRLEGVTTIEAANRFLAQTYLADHNARFAVPAAEEGSAFVPFVGDLSAVLCAKHERVVGNDNCVRFEGLNLQIPEQRHRRHYVRVTVQVRQYADGALAIFHGPRRLADYTSAGALIIGENQARTAA
ncbi:MAG TPA: ISNCY family transposase [Caulobacteraceae bacterium]|nr:ISNCY family transposase [Caulobacteraceae bacterium]